MEGMCVCERSLTCHMMIHTLLLCPEVSAQMAVPPPAAPHALQPRGPARQVHRHLLWPQVSRQDWLNNEIRSLSADLLKEIDSKLVVFIIFFYFFVFRKCYLCTSFRCVFRMRLKCNRLLSFFCNLHIININNCSMHPSHWFVVNSFMMLVGKVHFIV